MDFYRTTPPTLPKTSYDEKLNLYYDYSYELEKIQKYEKYNNLITDEQRENILEKYKIHLDKTIITWDDFFLLPDTDTRIQGFYDFFRSDFFNEVSINCYPLILLEQHSIIDFETLLNYLFYWLPLFTMTSKLNILKLATEFKTYELYSHTTEWKIDDEYMQVARKGQSVPIVKTITEDTIGLNSLQEFIKEDSTLLFKDILDEEDRLYIKLKYDVNIKEY